MGLEQSRLEITDYNQVTNNMKKEFWKESEYLQHVCNKQYEGHGTYDIKKAIPFLRIYFDKIVKNDENSLTVLEVGSGNGYNTNILAEKFDHIKIIATDLQKFNPNYYQIEQLASHEAVSKYGAEADILLMISPPCVGFMDYYAIKSYENVESKKEKYLIFVGEMGASDGSEGIYNYLIDGEIWNLVCRDLFHYGTDIFGGNIEKEVFLFKLK